MPQAPAPGAFLLLRKAVFEKNYRKNEVEYSLKSTFSDNEGLCFVGYVSVIQLIVIKGGLCCSPVIFKNVLSIPQNLVHLCNVIGKQRLSKQDPKS
jgi:hypothetical protein